jgi:hypothetical protein
MGCDFCTCADRLSHRRVEYGAAMAKMGFDAMTEVLLPRGVPEWLGSAELKDSNPTDG